MARSFNKRVVLNVLLDILSLASVGVPILLLRYLGSPKKRGFYCNDETIRYPYHSSTISTLVNVIVSYGAPLILILIHNFILSQQIPNTIRQSLVISYREITVFLFGVFTVQMISGVCKITTGSLRPHFIDVCKPNISFDVTNCGDFSSPLYVTEFTCLGNNELFPDASERSHRLNEAIKSFLSGHSSLAWYGMTFGAGYLYLASLQCNRQFSLLFGVAQALLLVYGTVVSITRVTDNKHHPRDVIAGAVLGSIVALLSLFNAKYKYERKQYSEVKQQSSETTNEEKL